MQARGDWSNQVEFFFAAVSDLGCGGSEFKGRASIARISGVDLEVRLSRVDAFELWIK